MANRITRGRTFNQSRSPKRVPLWISSADQGYVTVGAGASVIHQSDATLPLTTIVRLRGILSVKAGTSGADQDLIGAVGMGIVSTEAFAAGAASIPGPFSNSDWDGWLWWQAYAMRWEFGTAVGQVVGSVQQVIDNKAMRKVGANEVVVVMAESQAAAAVVAINFRLLVKIA